MYSRELRKLILHISCNQSICMNVKSKNINSLQYYIFFWVFFFTSIYMHKYITKYQFGITKCTQNFLYAVNVRYFFFKYGNCRNFGTFIYDTVNQNTHKLCLTSNIRQNCHCVNTLSPKIKIKQRKTTILTPQNHNHTKTLININPLKQ